MITNFTPLSQPCNCYCTSVYAVAFRSFWQPLNQFNKKEKGHDRSLYNPLQLS